MKKVFYLFAVIVAAGLFIGCDKTPVPDNSGTSQTEDNVDWNYFRGAVYVGDLNVYGAELKEAIEEFFPLITSDMASAKVVVAGESEI